MEPLSLTASAIATLIFSKALEKGGEQLGEAVSEKIGQLLNLIREKFQKEGVEGKLTKAQEEPNEKNKSRFERELAEQMEDDETFAQKLKTLMDELKSDEQVNQIFFKGVNVKGDAEIDDVEQTTTRSGSVTQEAVTEVEVGGNLKIGNVKQQS
ncbi:MAG: hypothetical protein AB4368_04610 [Xenococcaceae cyanobacterium]